MSHAHRTLLQLRPRLSISIVSCPGRIRCSHPIAQPSPQRRPRLPIHPQCSPIIYPARPPLLLPPQQRLRLLRNTAPISRRLQGRIRHQSRLLLLLLLFCRVVRFLLPPTRIQERSARFPPNPPSPSSHSRFLASPDLQRPAPLYSRKGEKLTARNPPAHRATQTPSPSRR